MSVTVTVNLINGGNEAEKRWAVEVQGTADSFFVVTHKVSMERRCW